MLRISRSGAIEPSASARQGGWHPVGLKTRSVEAGYLASFSAGRRGRARSSPPQLGQTPASRPSVQAAQNVHSNVQIRASFE
jgi:hypothetical protein